jgi:hypothetical protein
MPAVDGLHASPSLGVSFGSSFGRRRHLLPAPSSSITANQPRIGLTRMLPRLPWLIVLVLFAAGCAIPGRLYLVAPAISGNVRSAQTSLEGADLRLEISYQESADLHDSAQRSLSASGRFSFDGMELAVAGHEYGKNYRAFLHLTVDGNDRVIWRAQFSRLALSGEINLDCDLDRPLGHGQPCWVNDPLEQKWLIDDGERTFVRLCARCHGAGGVGGDAGSGAGLASPPPDLRIIAARRNGRFDRAEISEWIEGRMATKAHGTRRMPIWGEVLSAEYDRYPDGDELIGATLDPLVVYLESIQTPK